MAFRGVANPLARVRVLPARASRAGRLQLRAHAWNVDAGGSGAGTRGVPGLCQKQAAGLHRQPSCLHLIKSSAHVPSPRVPIAIDIGRATSYLLTNTTDSRRARRIRRAAHCVRLRMPRAAADNDTRTPYY